MKKLQKIGMRVAIAAVFATTLLVSVGSNSGISTARADDPGTGTGTSSAIWKDVMVEVGHYEGNGANRHWVHEKWAVCCGSGTEPSCTPVDCDH